MLSNRIMGEIIQYHIDSGYPDSFVVGRLVFMDADYFVIQKISPTGHWNGLALYMQSDIVAITQTTAYISRIQSLLKCRNEAAPFVPSISDNPLLCLLRYAQCTSQIVALELHASGYRDASGMVCELTKDTVTIKQVDEFGFPDGTSNISINAITRLFIADDESECLELLMACNKEAWDRPGITGYGLREP